MTEQQRQLPTEIMKKAVRGISYIAHPLRLRILEYLDVNGSSSVSAITKALDEEQVAVSQSLRKMRDASLVKTKRRGIFIYYDICEEYPASVFTCLRKLYGFMTDDYQYLRDDCKRMLPADYTMMAANRIKLFANYDKMRILEYLTLNGPQSVSGIIDGIGCEQIKVSQYLKRRLPAGAFHHLQHHQRRAQNLHRMYPQTLRFACRQIAVLIFSPAAAGPVLSRREPVSAAPPPAAAPFAKKPNPPGRLTSQNHESFR